MFNELKKLKKKAKALYLAANDFDDMDCGRSLAENIRPSIGVSREEFNKVWARIMELDANAPPNPFNI
jgi:hypothetical protein